MDKAELDLLRATIEQRRNAKVDAAEAEYRAKLAALDDVWTLCQSLAEKTEPKSMAHATADAVRILPPPHRSQSDTKETPTALIRKALRHMDAQFTNPTLRVFIEKNLGQAISPKEVASVLNKLHKRGEINVVRHGKPNQPAVYSGIPERIA